MFDEIHTSNQVVSAKTEKPKMTHIIPGKTLRSRERNFLSCEIRETVNDKGLSLATIFTILLHS